MADTVHVYPGHPPACAACLPSPPLAYSAAMALAAAHHLAGHRQTRCPGCGYWRWPWEYPAPHSEPTGLHWEPWRPTGREMRRWSLHYRWRLLGWVCRHWASRTWHADLIVRGRMDYRRVASGTLADCALALVDEVSGPADNLQK